MTEDLLQLAEDSTRGSTFLIYGSAISTIVMAIGTILILRFLGPDLYGEYALALVVPTLLYSFTDLGLNEGIIKYVASLRAKGEEERAKRIIGHGLALRTVIGLAIFAIDFFFADLFATLINRPGLGFLIRIASVSIVFQVVFTTAASASVGLDRAEYNATITGLNAFAKTVIQVALVLLSFGVAGALIGYVGGYAVASLVGLGLILTKMRASNKYKGTDKFFKNAKTLATYGFPLYISVLLTSLSPLYQNLIIAYYTPTNVDIGNLRSAANFVTLITVLTIPISTALLASFSKLDSSTHKKIQDFFKIANKYMCLIIVPTATLIIVFSKQIVQIVYGSSYQSAPLFLSLSSLTYFLVAIGFGVLGSLFNGLGETRTTFKMTLIGFLVFTVLSPLMIRPWGVPGMLIASLISSTASALYATDAARRKYKIEFSTIAIIKTYVISAIASVPGLVIVYMTALPNVLKLAAGALLYLFAYATLLPLTGTVTSSELQKVKEITQRIRMLGFIARPLIKYMERFSMQ
ncbi:MAG: flippase [Candidatus Bathyarchaeia archaeon]